MATQNCCQEDLSRFEIQEAPPKAYHIPNFVSIEEEEFLLNSINSAPLPKWTQLRKRRLQNWGGTPHAKGMVTEELPKWLLPSIDKIDSLQLFSGKRPNHVLINEYLPGQGIMPHTDGPLYHPVVTTISLGSDTLLDFHSPLLHSDTAPVSSETSTEASSDEPHDRYRFSLLLQRRSLFILTESLYKNYLHSIAERTADTIHEKVLNWRQCGVQLGDQLTRSTRISLTIRHVPKVIKNPLRLTKMK